MASSEQRNQFRPARYPQDPLLSLAVDERHPRDEESREDELKLRRTSLIASGPAVLLFREPLALRPTVSYQALGRGRSAGRMQW